MQPLSAKSKWWSAIIVLCGWIAVFGCCLLDSVFLLGQDYTDAKIMLAYICLGILVLAALVALWCYLWRFRRSLVGNSKMLATLYAVLALGFAFNVFARHIGVYAMPVTFAAMTLCIFYDSRVAFVGNVFLSALMLIVSTTYQLTSGIAIGAEYAAMLTAGFLVGTAVAVFLGRNTSRLNFILLGILLNLVGVWLIVLFGLADAAMLVERYGEFAYVPIMIFAPMLLSLLLQPLIERIFNIPSNFRLVELTDPRYPLMRQLQTEAPGTFNHSLSVANLVETCASVIGENVYMARAAAYYHDVGKLKNPLMFAENQTDRKNIHDELSPEASTDIIRKHTVNGELICREHHIPEEIARIAREHHGTTVIASFYSKAKEMTDGRDVDVKDFSYGGPIPSSKIAGLVMICDSCEAAIRASQSHEANAVDKLVAGIIDNRLRTGQFDNCPLTMRDLYTVRVTIVNATCGQYHERVRYPKSEEEQ